MKKSLNIVTLALGALGAAALPAHAQVIASENFSGYTTGSDVLGDGAAGGGWANSWADKNALDVVTSGNLTYTDGSGNTLSTSGNSLVSNGAANPGTASSEPERTLATTIGVSALANTPDASGDYDVWMSYLWQGGNTSATGNLFRQATMMFLKGASTTSSSPGGTEYMDVGMPNISTANVTTVNPTLSMWASSGNGGPTSSTAPVQSGVSANNGLTDFVLIEMSGTEAAWSAAGNAETMNVWINPTLSGSAPVGAPSMSYALQDLSVINAIRIQGGGYNATYGSLPGSETVSDILFGDTPADVEPVVTAPEPTSIGLAVTGGLALLALKRKKA